jgi:imidazolonepropionase
MPVLRDIGTLVTCAEPGGQGAVHPITDAALVWEDETIRWVGRASDLPAEYARWETRAAGGALVIPGLVDCHTHLAFGGWRAEEFEQRILGRSYLEIAAAGGGIASTVDRTRSATTGELRRRCEAHLAGMAELGVTTVEAKSGYGLSTEHELRLLEVYRDLAAGPQRVVATLLAAHVVPPDYRDHREMYLRLVTDEIIPQVAARGLARFCDAFVDEGAFSAEEGRRVLKAGQAVGLRPKLHADQLTSNGGAELAAELGAVTADHLEHISDAGIGALRASGTVAVSLPLASLYLNATPHRDGGAGGGRDRLQPRIRAKLPSPHRAHPRLHLAADDSGRSAQGRDLDRGPRGWPGTGGGVAGAGQVGRLRRDRRAKRRALALSPARQCLRADRGEGEGAVAQILADPS